MRRHYHSRQNYDLSCIGALTLIIAVACGPIGIGIWFLFKYLIDKFGEGILGVAIVLMFVVKAIIDL